MLIIKPYSSHPNPPHVSVKGKNNDGLKGLFICENLKIRFINVNFQNGTPQSPFPRDIGGRAGVRGKTTGYRLVPLSK